MNSGKEKIINNNNYGKYIHYLESNLIGISFIKIFAYRLMSSFKALLYIEKTGNLSIVEKGSVYVKKAQRNQDYLLTKINASNYYSLFLKNNFDEVNINLNDYSVIKHKLFKNFYLIYPNRNNLLKYVSKEGKINLIVLLLIIIFFIIGILAIFGII
jgi:hypothetical protein